MRKVGFLNGNSYGNFLLDLLDGSSEKRLQLMAWSSSIA
jgi:hypothetical protein